MFFVVGKCHREVDKDFTRVPEPLDHLNAWEVTELQIKVRVSVEVDSIFELEEIPAEILPFLQKEVKSPLKLILSSYYNLMIGEHAGSLVEVDF